MTEVVGGLRARLIRESVYQMIYSSLDALNWFDPTRPHLPVSFESKSADTNVQILENTAALGDESMPPGFDVELGSRLTERRWTMYVDFFGQNDALSLHFIRDVEDILEGRITAVGRTRPQVDVYDYQQATPPILFTCDIENVMVDRAHGFLKPWLEHWYSCSFTVVDVMGVDL